MSDIYERLNDEAEMRTGELTAREYHERYKPGRDCDPAPRDEPTYEEHCWWEEQARLEGLSEREYGQLKKALSPAKDETFEECKERLERESANKLAPISLTHDQREHFFQTMRDAILDFGVPFPRANAMAERILSRCFPK